MEDNKGELMIAGPIKWPLIGNLLDVQSQDLLPHEAAGKLARKYGDVVGLYLGEQPIVLISGVSAIKEALNKYQLQGRPGGNHRLGK